MGYAFISYSTRNQEAADAIKELFSENGIETWMAPGDIPAGSKYAGVINRAVRECDCFVLLLSKDAIKSPWVPKEVERAIDFRRPIIPVKIEEVVLNDEFELYISTNQLIAVKKIDKLSENIQFLLRSVKSIINISEKDASENSNETSELIESEAIDEDEQYSDLLSSVFDSRGTLNCPNCESGKMERVDSKREGFSIVKAVVGVAVAGPIGGVAGFLGRKKVTYKCNDCGHTFEKNVWI